MGESKKIDSPFLVDIGVNKNIVTKRKTSVRKSE